MDPQVIADTALYLNSDLAAKVTGVTIPVDAGHLILRPACRCRQPLAEVRRAAAALTAVLGRRAPCAPQSACHRFELWCCGRGLRMGAEAVTEPAGSRPFPMSLSVITGLSAACVGDGNFP